MRRFVVVGKQIPKGNKKALPTARGLRVVEKNPQAAEFGQLVKVIAGSDASQRGSQVLQGPTGVQVHFEVPRPKKIPADRKGWPKARPDVDKLVRTVYDGLSKVQYDDDDGICWALITKRYQQAGMAPSTTIQVDPLKQFDQATIPCLNCPHLRELFDDEEV